jgi:hypothetical protein
VTIFRNTGLYISTELSPEDTFFFEQPIVRKFNYVFKGKKLTFLGLPVEQAVIGYSYFTGNFVQVQAFL